MKSLESQVRNNSSAGNNGLNFSSFKDDNAQKYREKFIQLDEKYQGLKKKYLFL